MFTQGYVGFTSKTVESRWKEHVRCADSGSTLPIYNAIRKYGESLVVTTLVEGSDDYCLELEYRLRPTPRVGYNVATGGGAVMVGRVHSEESRALMSKMKSKENHPQFGKQRSTETRLKIAAANTGKTPSEETRAKVSGKNHHMFGKSHSKEHIDTVSRAMKGRPKSESQRAARRLYNLETMPWDYAIANKRVWSLAVELRLFMAQTVSPTAGQAAEYLCIRRGAVDKIYKKLKSGWNPTTDEAYLTWLSQYKQQEAQCQHIAC